MGNPSTYIETGKSPNNYLCDPISQATEKPTKTPIKQELRTRIKDSYMKIATILLLVYPKVSSIAIQVFWLIMFTQHVVTREKKLMISTNTKRKFNIFFKRSLIFVRVPLTSENYQIQSKGFFAEICFRSLFPKSSVSVPGFIFIFIFLQGRS